MKSKNHPSTTIQFFDMLGFMFRVFNSLVQTFYSGKMIQFSELPAIKRFQIFSVSGKFKFKDGYLPIKIFS